MKVLKRKGLLKAQAHEEEVKEPKKPRKSNTDNKLPSDEYKDEIPPKEIVLDENGKLVISVKRGGVDGLPRVDIRFLPLQKYTQVSPKRSKFRFRISAGFN